MGSDLEELLFEDDLYGARGAHSSSEDEEEQQQGGSGFPSHVQGGVDMPGASSASHQSSTLRASLDEDSLPTPSPPVDVPSVMAGGGGLRAGPRHVAGSIQPAHRNQQYTRLGTSAPIAIPAMMARWRNDKGEGGRPGEAAATFIPPHQLSKQDDYTFSFTGASPSGTLKRERLRARNAILRSTGFLEPQPGGAGGPNAGAGPAGAVAIPGLDMTSASGIPVARTPVTSSLTAALTTIGEA